MKLIIVVVMYRAFGGKRVYVIYYILFGYRYKHEPPTTKTIAICFRLQISREQTQRTRGFSTNLKSMRGVCLVEHHRRLPFALKTENVFYLLSAQPSLSVRDFYATLSFDGHGSSRKNSHVRETPKRAWITSECNDLI